VAEGNQYWVGSNGAIWVNDLNWDKVKSFEAKAAYEFEEVPDGLETERVLIGYNVEGTIVMRKTDSRAILLISDDYQNGIVTDVKIIGKAFNKSTGKTERVAYRGVTFDELPLSKFEEKTVTEVELPFKAKTYKILQTA